MADPLSIAGLATGVISLGLQLFEGVKEYLDAVKARPKEIESAQRQADNMRKLLEAIDDLLPRLQNDHPKSAVMIQHHVKPCEEEIRSLNDFLLALCRTSTTQSSIRSKFEEQRKKLSYPFNRANISQLESRLEKVNCALQMALQLAGLDISIDTHQSIRRLHDLVVRSTNSTPSNNIVPLRKQPGHTQLTLMNPNAIDAVLKLTSKPSYLSASLNQLESSQRAGRPKPSNQICICRPSRRTTRREGRLAAVSFSSESSSLANHLLDCPFSQITGSQHTASFTIEFDNLKWLLRKAVSISFSLQHGAGGFSISPVFTYYPAVDENIAPAFRIMNLIRHIISVIVMSNRRHNQLAPNSANPIKPYARVIQYGFEQVISLYRRGKASPRDIDSRGRSLIHSAVESLWSLRSHEKLIHNIEWAFLPGFNKLISSGVPASVHDSHGHDPGRTPAGTIMFSFNHADFFATLASLVLSAGPDTTFTAADGRWGTLLSLNCLDYYRMDLNISEAANCGPLSLAAIAGNEGDVSHLLDRYPATCNELNIFGQTPIHLAVLHPNCLRLIVKKSERSILDTRDVVGDGALDYAVRVGGCEESVVVLIEHQCSINLRLLQYPMINESCMGIIVAGLRKRRDQLEAFALRHLPELEIIRLGLGNGNTLDQNAQEVQQILDDRGIMLPDGIKASAYEFWGFTSTSVFHARGDIKLFDMLWEHKFRDINALDYRGKPPLLVEPWTEYDANECYARYRWLIEHGADVWTPFSDQVTTGGIEDPLTPAHFLFATIGAWWDVHFTYEPPNIEVIRFLTKELLAVHVSDDCSCHCTLGGCTPLGLFLRALTRGHPHWGPLTWPRRFDNPQALASPLVRFIREAQSNFTMEQHLAVVKYMTHKALDIAHTCCRFTITHGYRSRHLPAEEVEEINSEQTHLLELLDDLVVEFEEISREERNGLPLGISDPEEFWTCRWVERVNEVLKGLDGDNIEKEERSKAETIGVVWDTTSPSGSEARAKVEFEKTPEYFMCKLECIMKEH